MSGVQFEFLARLRHGLQRCETSNQRILVAVSGGPDSVALVTGLVRLAAECQLEVVVGHVNHCLRGSESDQDSDWVAELAEQLQLRSVLQSVTAAAVADTDRNESIEESARRVRYQLLIEAARSTGCSAIAVGHTADDQAETVLHHILRGTGVAGLRGIPRTRQLDDGIRLVRPLLEVSRTDVLDWLNTIGQTFRTDRTNAESVFTRNRIRNALLPQLERDFNPQFRRVLGTLAMQAGELSEFLRGQAELLAARAVRQQSANSLRIDCDVLRGEPRVLMRETLVTIWQQAGWPLQRMGFREWEQLADLVLVQTAGAITLPYRIDARRRGGLLVLQRAD